MNYTDITFILELGRYDTLLLDRDGIINEYRPNDYVKKWDEFAFIPAFLEVIPQWSKLVKHIVIITNQRGISKGLFTEEDLQEIHDKMVKQIEKVGGRIDKIYHCTALDNKDPNRKPQTGMFQQMLKDFPETDVNRCLMVGDMMSDMQFACNCGIAGILINEKPTT